jgi:hypothetical protein
MGMVVTPPELAKVSDATDPGVNAAAVSEW